MARWIATLVALAALCPVGAQAQGFGVRVTPEGLEQLRPLAMERLPSAYTVPALTRQVYDCPLSSNDIVAHVPDVPIGIEWQDFAVVADDGVLVVEAAIDIEAATMLRIEKAYGCFGEANCDLSLAVHDVRARIEVAASTSPAGGVELHGVQVDIDLELQDLQLDSEGCAIGDAIEWLIEFPDEPSESLIGDAARWVVAIVRDWAYDRLVAKAEEVLAEKVGTALTTVLSDAVGLTIDRNGFQVHGWIQSLDIDSQAGITLVGDADMVWTGDAVRNDPAPFTEVPVAAPLPLDFGPGQFQVAASDRLVTLALYEAWRGGMINGVLAGSSPTIELGSDGVVQQLGLPEGTRIETSIELERPMTASFGREGQGTARIGIDGLRVDLRIVPPEPFETSDVTIRVDGALAAGLAVDTDLGGLILDVRDLDIAQIEIESSADTLVADRARLREFVRETITPMLAERLAGVPVAPALNEIGGTFAYVRTLDASSGWQRAGVDLVHADPTDSVAPETFFEDPAELVAAGTASFPVYGQDASTPVALMRYVAWLDGEPLGEGMASGIRAIRVDVADGSHALEVAAVDLNGNQDPTPVLHEFVADGTAPELTVEDAPRDYVMGRSITAAWSATDARDTVLQSRWELRIVENDGSTHIVAEEDFGADVWSLEVGDLSSDRLYELEIVVRDRAGNLTSEVFGFVADPGGSAGCSAAPGGGGAPWELAFLLPILLVFGRRRRLGARRAAATTAGVLVALFLASPVAEAQTVGTLFSGPTTADGSSAFFNPAAMAEGEGTHLQLDLGVLAAYMDYAPIDDELGSSETTAVRPTPTLGGFTDAIADELRVGLTVSVPYTSGGSWDRNDGAGQMTRYYLVDGKVFHISAIPAVSYTPVEWLTVGAGANIVFGSLSSEVDKDFGAQLNQMAGSTSFDTPFPYAHPDLASPALVSGSGWGIGAVGGLLLRPVEQLSIGAGVHSPVSVAASGTVDVAYPERVQEYIDAILPAAQLPQLSGTIDFDLDLPLTIFAGVAVRPDDQWELSADYRFQHRSTDPALDLTVIEATNPAINDQAVVKAYSDRHSIVFRTVFAPIEELSLAMVIRYETNIVPETTFTPNNMDFAKWETGVAARWDVSRSFTLMAQYSHYFIPSRQITESVHRPLPQASLQSFNHPSPTGTYSAAADTFQLSAALRL